MGLLTFEITDTEVKQRLDSFLVDKLGYKYSRVFIQRLIADGNVKANSENVKAHYKLKEKDVISLDIPDPSIDQVEAEDIALNIVFEDNDLAVIDKPAGMVVHPAKGNSSGTLLNALLFHSRELSNYNGDPLRKGIVHRLDKDTSGLIVVAKTDDAFKALAKQFKAHTIRRRYIALVKGNVQLEEGVIDLPIGRDRRHREKMKVDPDGEKKAFTYYKVLERFDKFSMLELTPKTGRTHQIRVHLSFIGYPVLGDIKYGGTSKLIDRQALHAVSLGFNHPRLSEFMEFTSNLPSDMQELIKQSRNG